MNTQPSHLNILAVQPHIPPTNSLADRRKHVARLLSVVRGYCQHQLDIDLIVLPELSTVAYAAETFQRLPELAEPVEGETFQQFAEFAQEHQCAVCYGFPRIDNGRYFISQAVIGADGNLITYYDKLHLGHFGFSTEKDYFSHGNQLGVFELQGFRLGIVICYDFRFPQLMQRYRDLYDVDVILHPVAFAKDGTYPSWHPFAITRALENHVYFLSLNQAGDFWGNSIFCPPWIDDEIHPTTFGQDEQLMLLEVKRRAIEVSRRTYPYAKDQLATYELFDHSSPERVVGIEDR